MLLTVTIVQIFNILTEMLTQEQLKSLFTYNSETGDFKRIDKFYQNCYDSKSTSAYLKRRINGKYYLVHRLIWLYVYGFFPTFHIDHINGNRKDNRLVNLREVNTRQNLLNKVIHRNGRLPGSGCKIGNLWLASYKIKGKRVIIGKFNTPEESQAAYLTKMKELGLLDDL